MKKLLHSVLFRKKSSHNEEKVESASQASIKEMLYGSRDYYVIYWLLVVGVCLAMGAAYCFPFLPGYITFLPLQEEFELAIVASAVGVALALIGLTFFLYTIRWKKISASCMLLLGAMMLAALSVQYQWSVKQCLLYTGEIMTVLLLVAWNISQNAGAIYFKPKEEMARALVYRQYRDKLRKIMLSRNALGCYIGKCVAVYGGWGSGKTHFISYIKYSLSQRIEHETEMFCGRFSIAHVDLWACNTSQEAWGQIIAALSSAINERPIGRNGILSYIHRLFYYIYPTGVRETLEAVQSLVLNDNSTDAAYNIRSISDKINFPDSGRAVLLIVDDVERAKPEVSKSLLPILDRLRQIPGLLVICAISKEEWESEFAKQQGSKHKFYGYLEKLFDLSLPLPDLTPERSYKLFKGYAAKTLKIQSHALRFLENYPIFFDSPRRMRMALACLEHCEASYMAPEGGRKNEFIHEPSSKGSNYNIIFIMELLKLFADSQLRSFFKKGGFRIRQIIRSNTCKEYYNIKQFGYDTAYVVNFSQHMRECLNRYKEKSLFSFLEETDEQTWLVDSLFANLLSVLQSNIGYDEHIQTYATNCYLTVEEGDKIVDVLSDGELNTSISNAIESFTGRVFHEAELVDATENLIDYVLQDMKIKDKRDKNINFLAATLPKTYDDSRYVIMPHIRSRWECLINLYDEKNSHLADKIYAISGCFFQYCNLTNLYELIISDYYAGKVKEVTKDNTIKGFLSIASGFVAFGLIPPNRDVKKKLWLQPYEVYCSRIVQILNQDECDEAFIAKVVHVLNEHPDCQKDNFYKQLARTAGKLEVSHTLEPAYQFICNMIHLGAFVTLPEELASVIMSMTSKFPPIYAMDKVLRCSLFDKWKASEDKIQANNRELGASITSNIRKYQSFQKRRDKLSPRL